MPRMRGSRGALELCREALETSLALGLLHNVAFGLHILTVVAAVQGRPERAARIWGAAEALRTVLGIPLSRAEHGLYDEYVEAARARMEPAAWEQALRQGRLLSPEQAVAEGLAG